jgi:hypothetical protein
VQAGRSAPIACHIYATTDRQQQTRHGCCCKRAAAAALNKFGGNPQVFFPSALHLGVESSIMFSALKKMTGGRNATSPGGGGGPGGDGGEMSSNGVGAAGSNSIRSMPASLQKKFSRGVHYNMKLLLRQGRQMMSKN